MSRYVFSHARAVLPDRVLDDALLVAEDGLITEVGPATPGQVPAEAVDLRGALLLPGIVDTHSDALEKEQRPRPTVRFPAAFAVASYEGRVRAAGVTTMFHAISYQTNEAKDRTIERSLGLGTAVRERAASGTALIDHRKLHRLDARDAAALDVLMDTLAEPAEAGDVPPLVSYEDHTPGQGQFSDLSVFRKVVAEQEKISEEAAGARIEQRIADRDRTIAQRERTLAFLGREAKAGRIRLLAHDVVSAAELAEVRESGAAVAEFPTTLEAARAAKAAGMPVVAGAPNVLRGGSHSGNVSAVDLVCAGLVDNLSSDYMPTTLLAAAYHLAHHGVLPLPAAVGLVTSGAARTAGLGDRGALVPGQRADLIAVTGDVHQQTVRFTLLAEESRAAERPPVTGYLTAAADAG
ncbi:alpha-D-ribose 1-methylphosphonate 5-triphosphate diphosphatase [Streptomyces sp. TS71-3]|uniref:alpha-D-ribose 1-methylphosphonate 5-triphosphate diphosphatase n=1 Tax=Streptomyces sp. TS71-3 TaxID=2733862 RepID=UPI001B1B34B4|nr:alpha-D-ribose 1-methylphosphonate 5-triphosphate diphosphatase [Streptomyces sp. TS71-3]GHJ35621.1 amidohydrolase [Streptomyces sp. TS71-3]